MLEGGELAVLLCLCALIGCLALALPALAQTPADGNLEGQLDSLIRAQMRERKIVGVAVAVVRSDKVDWNRQRGAITPARRSCILSCTPQSSNRYGRAHYFNGCADVV